MMRAVAYARVSSREQAEGYSLSAQMSRMKEHAERNNLKIVKMWEVAESAKKEGRIAFNEMIDYVKDEKNKVRAVILEKVDRVGRNFRDTVTVKNLMYDHNKVFHFVRENIVIDKNSKSSTKFQFDIQAVLAENYINNLADEVKKGVEGKLENGGWPATAPFGYRNNKLDKTIQIDPDKIIYVQKAFELYATGTNSLREVSRILHKDGLTERGKPDNPISKTQLHIILKNPFYIGLMDWKGKIYKGDHEPAISEELFYRVQEILHDKKRPRKLKRSFQFSKLIKCGVCGSSYTTEIQKEKYIYYRCTEHNKKHSHCYWREEKLVDEIAKILKGFKLPPNVFNDVVSVLKDSHKNEVEFHDKAINQLETKLKKLQSKKDLLYEDRLDELITKEDYKERFDNLKKQESKLLRDIKRHKEANSVYLDTGIKILELSQRASELFIEANEAERRELLEFLFSNLIITDEKLSYEARSPFKEILNFANRKEWSGMPDLNRQPHGPKPCALAN